MKRSILLIVDDWEAQERYEERLSQFDEIVCAPFLSTGIQYLNDPERKFDVVLVDLTVESSPEDFFKMSQGLKLPKSIFCILSPGKTISISGVSFVNRPFEWDDLLRKLSTPAFIVNST